MDQVALTLIMNQLPADLTPDENDCQMHLQPDPYAG
jgi:hypothetical protein